MTHFLETKRQRKMCAHGICNENKTLVQDIVKYENYYCNFYYYFKIMLTVEYINQLIGNYFVLVISN